MVLRITGKLRRMQILRDSLGQQRQIIEALVRHVTTQRNQILRTLINTSGVFLPLPHLMRPHHRHLHLMRKRRNQNSLLL